MSSLTPESDNHALRANSPPQTTCKKAASLRSLRTVRQRTRTGCLTCRARKIKCDESQPFCQNCKRCVLECAWPVVEDLLSAKTRRKIHQQPSGARHSAPDAGGGGQTGGSGQTGVAGVAAAGLPTATITNTFPHPSTGANTVRVARSAACASCRVARCGCSLEVPRCSRCREFGLVCKYEPAVPPDETQDMPAEPAPRPAGDALPTKLPATATQLKTAEADFNIDLVPKSLILQHIHAFFSHIYHCQANGFIHRGTLLRLFQTGRINRKLLLAICAASSRFIPASDPLKASQQAQAWTKEAKTLLILEDMTIDTVTTALLLARHDINSGKFDSAWMLSSLANRAALALGLNREAAAGDDDLPFTEQETRRRLFWACYCLDRMMSTGKTDLISLNPSQILLRLPCEEHQYLYGILCWTPVPHLEVDSPVAAELPPLESLQAERDVGLFGHYVQIMEMRYCILRYVRNRPGDGEQPPPWDAASRFAQCERKMTLWRRSLLPQFQLLPDTIYVRQAHDQLSSLVMLHVWYDQCMSDLYRIAMPGFPETLPASALLAAPAGWVQQQQLACVRHATNILATFKTVADLVDMSSFVFLDTSLPMCVFESIRVQLQWLFMLPPDTLQERAAECQANCETLMGHVDPMAKYFRQAQWLLKEMRRMLLRHDIPFRGILEPNNDSSGAEAHGHPWQRRIQQLKHDKAHQASAGMDAASAAKASPAAAPQRDARQQLGASAGSGSQYALPQATNFDFFDDVGTMGQDDISMSVGSDEAQPIPGLVNFMGMACDWLANGIQDESALQVFNSITE